MKKLLICALALISVAGATAQDKIGYKFYGQIRTDLFYNSRANVETVDGLYYMYPKDKVYDAQGKDLNGYGNSNLYAVYTRFGLDVAGPEFLGAKTSAKIEGDFRGFSSNLSVARLRHAYMNLKWDKDAILVGQTWNPLYGEVAPQILNLDMGSPFQPFGRAPQIRYQRTEKALQFTGALLWQSQYLSQGPVGKSNTYIKNSNIPEMFVGLNYKDNNWLFGAGIDMISLVPRLESKVDGKTYKVSERITTLSYEAHIKYTSPKWYVAAKSTLGSNLTQASMLGGYGVTKVDDVTGEAKYTPIKNSASWVNVVYGKTWKPMLFFGYMKNLGTSKDLLMTKDKVTVYGTGYDGSSDIDKLVSGSAGLTYNIPHWKFGFEYNYTEAWYGKMGKNGKVNDTHSVNNNRLVFSGLFMF